MVRYLQGMGSRGFVNISFSMFIRRGDKQYERKCKQNRNHGSTAVLKDRPEGVPVMAAFLLSDTDSGIEVDDMKRQQFWAVNENLPILSGFTVCGK